MRIILPVLLLCFFHHQALQAQEDSTKFGILEKLRFNAYGVVNYYAYDWETLPNRKNAIDPERMNMYLYYDFSDLIEFKSEIEFEHGGTGVTMGFDPLEEFGEFEQEVEKGGEVVLEQINLLFKFHEAFKVRVGKMRFYMGNASKQDEPKEYFTAYRSELENTILPLGWYETGIEVSGNLKLNPSKRYPYLSYKAYLVSGLDNTGFSSYNWIRNGYQTRFLTINADNLAYALRLDYVFADESELGFNIYAGNPTGNRPKADFTADSWVTYGDVHFTIDKHPFRARAYGMAGHVQNSEALSAANRNLSNNLDVKRTPVGQMAAGVYGEIAYDILPLFTKASKNQLYPFVRAEWYDSMYQTQGDVSKNPRYERTVYTLGLNYFPHPNIVFKSHFAWRQLGSGEQENTFALGFGFNI
jgi:hypothetical protein